MPIWKRKKEPPDARNLLLEIIPKVELEPVKVPDRFKVPQMEVEVDGEKKPVKQGKKPRKDLDISKQWEADLSKGGGDDIQTASELIKTHKR